MARTMTTKSTSAVKPKRREAASRRVPSSKSASQPRVGSAPGREPVHTPPEREESSLEREFIQAMQAYKQSSGRMFPTWSEVLEVLQHLGYRKQETAGSSATVEPALSETAVSV